MNPRELFLHHYAFLVGIDDYDHDRFENLSGAHSDATTLRDALHWVGYNPDNIHVVSAEDVTLGGLKSQIEIFIERFKAAQYNPDIVVFWAGHGIFDNNGNFLVVRNTMPSSASDWRSCALSLDWVVGKFQSVLRASLTMFFDVCHSDLRECSHEQILNSMVGAAQASTDRILTTFIGVSTSAYEVWDRQRYGGKVAGILADTVQLAVRGEPCDQNDKENCHNDHFTVTDGHVVANCRLKKAVERRARLAGVDEQLLVRAPGGEERERAIGFAVRKCFEAKLNELRLPPEVEALARLVAENLDPRQEGLTTFGLGVVELTRKLIHHEITMDGFSAECRALTCVAILKLQQNQNLKQYMFFLLYCYEEAKNDDGAKDVLELLYNYLLYDYRLPEESSTGLQGDPAKDLGDRLHNPYRTFAVRHASPWSCGIPVLHNGEVRYAPIIYHNEHIRAGVDRQRVFETTAPLQREALLDVWRTSSPKSTIRDLNSGGCYERFVGELSQALPPGERVWVRIGLDAQGCKDKNGDTKEKCARDKSVFVPMKITLGEEGRAASDYHHWHLKLGDKWPKLRGPQGSDSEPSWAAGLSKLMNEVAGYLEGLLTSNDTTRQQGDEAAALVKWLYFADVMIRMLDESKLRRVVFSLIAEWQAREERSVPRLAQALLIAMGEERGYGDARLTGRGISGETVLAEFSRWRAEETQEHTARDNLRRAELLAILLNAVLGREDRESAAEQIEIMEMNDEELVAWLAEVMVAGGRPQPQRAYFIAERVIITARRFLRETRTELRFEEREALQRWIDRTEQTLGNDPSESVLKNFLVFAQSSIGMGGRILARVFWSVAGTRELRGEFGALEARLWRGGDQQDTRVAAEEVFQWLREFHLSRLGDDGVVPREGNDVLSLFFSMLHPAAAQIVLATLATDVHAPGLLIVTNELLDTSELSIADAFQVDDNEKLPPIGVMNEVINGPSLLSRKWIGGAGRSVPPEPVARTQPAHSPAGERYRQELFLAIPQGEPLGP